MYFTFIAYNKITNMKSITYTFFKNICSEKYFEKVCLTNKYYLLTLLTTF